MKYVKFSALFFGLLFSSAGFAVVECNVVPMNYYTGEGIFWVNWDNGGAGSVNVSDSTYKTIVASVMLAGATGRRMVVRYADGASCTATGIRILGIWSIR
jgi:hypothetical protein